MTVFPIVSGFARAHRLAPYVGAATILALLSFLSIDRFGIVTVIVGVLALTLFCVVVVKPELATLAVVFVMYSNAAAVAVHSHPALTPVAIGFFLLLFIPMINFVVFRREGLRTDTVLWLMMLYMAIMVMSAIFSRAPAESFKTIVKFVFEGLAFYFLIINSVRSPQILRKAIWVLLLVASVLGALSWHQNLTERYKNDYAGFAATNLVLPDASNVEGDRIDTGEQSRGAAVKQFRALGPVSDPNFYSQIMVAVLPFALVLAFSGRSKWARVMGAAACVLIMAGIILSFSRGAAIAVIVVGICLFFLRYLKLRYAFVFAAALVVVIVSSPAYLNRIGSIGGLSSHHLAAADASLQARSGVLRTGLQVFLQHPLLGVGAGRANEYIEISGVGFSAGARGLAPHNAYLELFVETGILGFSCFMAIVSVTVRNLLRAGRYWIGKRPEYAHMCMAFMLSIVAFLTTSLFLHLAYPRYYWLLMGLAGAAAKIFSPEAERTLPGASSALACPESCRSSR